MSGPETHAEPVREAVRAYAARQPQLVAATAGWVTLVRTLLDDAGIDYLSVTGRMKSVASFSAKANRTDGDRLLYPDPLEQVTDQIGVRVITYVHSDVAAVARGFGFQAVTVRSPADLVPVATWVAGDRSAPLLIDAKVTSQASWWLEEAFGH